MPCACDLFTGYVYAVLTQYGPAQMRAIAAAGFGSVRVFMPFKKDANLTKNQIDDALSNGLSIVVCMWGLNSWSEKDISVGIEQIAKRWDIWLDSGRSTLTTWSLKY